MTIHDMSKREKAIWLILVFALMFLENKSIDKDRSDASIRDGKLIENSQTLVIQTKALVDQVGRLVPQVTLTASTVRTLQDQQSIAIKANDTKRVAELRHQIDTAQQAADDASLRLLLTMAPGLVDELQKLGEQFSNDDRSIEKQESRALASDNSEGVRNDYTKQRHDLEGLYVAKIRPLMASANYLREELLRRQSPSQQTDEDKKNAVIFARAVAGQSITWRELADAASYLGNLVRKFPV